jgi:proteasome activator subunit 4
MFIVAAVQHIKVGDLTLHPSGFSESSDDEDEMMDEEEDFIQSETPRLSRADERSLARDSTSGFAGKFRQGILFAHLTHKTA